MRRQSVPGHLSALGEWPGGEAMLPLAVFTADDEQIFTVTLDLPVQACKNASLSLANVAWYVLHTV